MFLSATCPILFFRQVFPAGRSPLATSVLLALSLFCCCQVWAEPLFDAPERDARGDPMYEQVYRPRWEAVVSAETARPGLTPSGEGMNAVDARNWRNMLELARDADETKRLRLVNGFFNQWRPRNDSVVYGTAEHWATPEEFITHRGGDCEDYAIAKYFALKMLGIPDKRMRLVVIRQVDTSGNPLPRLHAVLAVRTAQTWFILDNNARPKMSIMPHTQYQGRFVPLYSMNEYGAWKHRPDPLRQKGPVP